MLTRPASALALSLIVLAIGGSAAAQQPAAGLPDFPWLNGLVAGSAPSTERPATANRLYLGPAGNASNDGPRDGRNVRNPAALPELIAWNGPAVAFPLQPASDAWDVAQPLVLPRVVPVNFEMVDLPSPAPPDKYDCLPATGAPQTIVTPVCAQSLATPQADACPAPTAACNPCPAPTVTGQACPGFYAGAEVTLLRPFAGDLTEAELSVPLLGVDLLTSDPVAQMTAAPRIWIGYVTASGEGLRVRYWQYEEDLNGERSDSPLGILPPGSERISHRGLNAFDVDIEVTQHVESRIFNVDVGVGMRVAGLDRDRSITYVIPGVPDTTFAFSRDFTGIGPTISADVRRPLGNSGLAFVVNPRGTMLFGTVDTALDVHDSTGLGGITTPIVHIATRSDAEAYVAEVRMGGEWSRVTPSGREWFAHVLWENQFWAGSGVGLTGVGLTGVTLGLGIRH
jgi:hypothetical protein